MFSSKADDLIERFKPGTEGFSAGVTSMADVQEIAKAFLGELLALAKQSGLLGEEGKAKVKEYVEKFYAAVIEPIDLPGPDLIVDRTLLSAMLMFVDWSFDQIGG